MVPPVAAIAIVFFCLIVILSLVLPLVKILSVLSITSVRKIYKEETKTAVLEYHCIRNMKYDSCCKNNR